MWGSNGLPAARPRESFATLPVTVDLSPSRAVAIGNLMLAIVLVVLAIVFRNNLGALQTNDSIAALLAIGIPIAMLCFSLYSAARGISALLSRRTARFEGDRVHVSGRTIFGTEDWSAPLDEFEGVGWRIVVKQRRTSGSNSTSTPSRSRVYQVIELIHPDPARTLPLYVRQSRANARDVWEGITRTLGVPAIDLREGARHARAAEDLDKSVRELAAEGKAAADWDPDSEPPPGLSWESSGAGEDQTLTVRLHARRFPLWLYGGIGGLGLVLLIAGIMDLALLPALFGVALIGGTAWYWKKEPERPRELRITRNDVTFVDPMVSPGSAKSLQHRVVEEIHVVPSGPGSPGPGKIAIISDAGEIRTGEGLSQKALDWLRNYLTSAVVEA